MTYSAKLKKRAPLWVCAILLTVVIVAVIIIVLHLTGFYDFSFLGIFYLQFHMWEADDISVINALIGDVGIAALGIVIYYFFAHYVFGYKANLPITPQQAAIQTNLSVQPQPIQQNPITVEEAK